MKTSPIWIAAAGAVVLGGSPAFAGVAHDKSVPIIDAGTERELRELYRHLIAAENAHDIAEVRRMVWRSPTAVFVAKTKTSAEGNWGAFWGSDAVVAHIDELFQSGVFKMDPDFDGERVVLLSPTVAETYTPLKISVAYAGQPGTPKPFLMIVDWVRVGRSWKMATDIALPIPPSRPDP